MVCQGNICFLTKKNPVYGKHLKELIKRGVAMKILFYKVPSYIRRVKYKKAVENLYKTVIIVMTSLRIKQSWKLSLM